MTDQTTRPSGSIALVEDNEIDVTLAQRCLARSSLPNALEVYRTGADFLEQLERVERGEADAPVVALIDIDMARMNGFRLFSEIRELGSELPVVFFTSSDDPVDIERCERLGVRHQLKPPNVEGYVDFFELLL